MPLPASSKSAARPRLPSSRHLLFTLARLPLSQAPPSAPWAPTGNPESSPPRHIFNLLTSAVSFAKKGDTALGTENPCPSGQPGPQPQHTAHARQRRDPSHSTQATHARGGKEGLWPPGLASQGDSMYAPALQNTQAHTHTHTHTHTTQ